MGWEIEMLYGKLNGSTADAKGPAVCRGRLNSLANSVKGHLPGRDKTRCRVENVGGTSCRVCHSDV